jgi:hypothetical protein
VAYDAQSNEFFNQREGARQMNNKTVFSGVQMKWLAVFAAVFCLSLAGGASAADKPCAADAAKLCAGMQPGGGAMGKCLQEHSNDLSPECKETMGKMKGKMQDFKQACKDDAAKLCKDTKPGGGKIVQCLKQHEGDLSAACKDAMAQSKGKM